MEKGYIKINFEDYKNPLVEMRLVNNDLWLIKSELARFFGVSEQKITAELNAIFRNRLLYERDCVRCNRYIDKGLEKQTTLYNLDVLIFLAYRLDSVQAQIFRRFLKSALYEHLRKPKQAETKIVWTYLPKYNENNYWLN